MKKVILANVILVPAILLLVLIVGSSRAQVPEPSNSVFGSTTLANGSWGTANDRMTVITPTVYSQGQVRIRGTWSCDLDLGNETRHAGPTRDFQWDQITEVERYLAPKNGAQFHVVGIVDINSIGYSDLRGYSYSTESISGSDDASNQLPEGTVVAAVTNEGRYSKFRIDVNGYHLTITWLTYNKPYSSYLPLVLRNFPW